MQHKQLSVFITLLIVLLFSSTGRSQTADKQEGCSPLTVKFTAPGGASGYFWDFKDGSTSVLQNPVRIFTQPGNYVVEFRESAGGPIIGTVPVTIYEKPDLDVLANPASGCAPLITFLQQNNTISPGINVTNFSWSFGDGNASSGPSVVNTYENAGSYTVALSIETNKENCDVSEIFPDLITVSAGPQVAFTTDPNPPVACTPPLNVSFTNETLGNNIDYFWNFGNGNTSTEENPADQAFIFAGEYTISLTATDSTGCSTSTQADVKIGQPTANFIIPDTVCVNEPVVMENLSGAGVYSWSFGPGASPTTATVANPEVIFTQAGTYNVSLNVTAGTCAGDTSFTVYAQELNADFVADPTFSCSAPFEVSFSPLDTTADFYSWDFGDNQTSTDTTPVHTYFRPDTSEYSLSTSTIFTAALTVSSSAGCTITSSQEITLNESKALFMPNVTKGCVPLDVTFSDSSLYDVEPLLWVYHYGDGMIDTFNTEGPHTHTYSDTGSFEVKLVIIDANGCRDTSYGVLIETGIPLTPIFNTNLVKVCPGDTLKLSDFTNNPHIDAWHFETDGNRSFHCYGDSVLFWAFNNDAGLMDVTLTVEYNGCYSSATKNNYIFVEGPIAHIDYEITCDNPFNVQFRDSSQEATNILWNFGDGQISSQPNPVHTYAATGDYLVTLTAFNTGNNCEPSIDSVIVHIRDIQASINLDTALCDGVTYDLDGSQSQDVDADCWKGYTWFFTFNRPITTQDSITSQLFDSPGDHQVSLEVTDINGCKDTAVLDVTVYQVSAQFSADKDLICFPADVQFNADSSFAAISNIESYEWDFGDGTTLEDVVNPVHTYQNASSNPITVTLKVVEDSPASCSNTTTLTINYYTPISSISTNPFPAQLCVGEEISFSATDYTAQGSSLTFDWDFDNNETGDGQNVSTIYNAPGTYNVLLSFEEIATGCTGSTSTTVQVQDFPVAAFTSPLDDEDVLCAPIAVASFTNSSISTAPIGQILWDFGNNQTGIGQTSTTSFDKGTFVVQMIASTTFGCRDTTTKEYTVVGPEGDFSVDDDLICKGDVVTFTLQDTADVTSYQWDFGDGTTLDNVNPAAHKYATLPPSGETVARLILQSKEGCEIILEETISFHIVLADFIPQGNDYIACIEESIQLISTSSNANSFQWDFGDGDISVEQEPQTTYEESGTYTVQLIVLNTTNGCRDTISKLLAVAPDPVPVIIPDTICEEDAATLTVTTPENGSTYIWSPGALVLEDTANTTTTISLIEPTSFTVTEINSEGCIGSSLPVEIVVLPLPDIIEAIDTITCPNQPLALPVSKLENYAFVLTPIENAVDLEGEFPVVQVSEATQLELEVTDVFGVGCSTGIIPVSIDVPNEEMLVPDIFTPNNDGLNDYFNFVPAIKNATLTVLRFQIYNRFGQLVYDNETPDDGWDGNINGKNAEPDSYIYMIEAAIEGCANQTFEGEVLLLR